MDINENKLNELLNKIEAEEITPENGVLLIQNINKVESL